MSPEDNSWPTTESPETEDSINRMIDFRKPSDEILLKIAIDQSPNPILRKVAAQRLLKSRTIDVASLQLLAQHYPLFREAALWKISEMSAAHTVDEQAAHNARELSDVLQG